MSSQDDFAFASSPASILEGTSTRRRKSRFTFKQLTQLSLFSTTCPLRVIAHIDLDAFYAQCESIRLGLPEDQPLAVQQWGGLIAINYPSRAHGVTRFMDMAEAKKKCPNLKFQHVATWKEGEDRWAYREDSADNIAFEKVSLDLYRSESRKILELIKECLPPGSMQRVEKASIDEVFLDLSAQAHSILLERYPEELARPPPYDDPSENLPPPPTTALDWKADSLIDLDTGHTELDDPDWDDISMLVASEIVRDIRATIREKLKYTCSAGIARNKMLAKLGSGHKKPNNQTIVRNRAVQQFLSEFKFTKIRNLGGKLGEQVVAAFGTESVSDLLKVPLEQLKSKLDDDSGSWLYKVIRGEDTSEVNSRTQIKSMLSAKSFRPSINSQESAIRWLRIFVADIFNRLVVEGILENKRRPKTMNLHHRQGGVVRSRQLPISTGKKIDETALFDLAKTLLSQVIIDGRAWPCANLSLSVGGFEEGPAGNRGIGTFLVRGDEAKAMNDSAKQVASESLDEESRVAKRRKVDDGGIQKFFGRYESSKEEFDDDFEAEDIAAPGSRPSSTTPMDSNIVRHRSNDPTNAENPDADVVSSDNQGTLDNYICAQCRASIPIHEQAEHEDWHFAKNLQAKERTTEHKKHVPVRPAQTNSKMKTVKPQKGPRKPGGGSIEKGQSKLAFG